MQHSPTDVKKRLDQAVDPDGNVMDLVAVLEIVSILEKLPLTKEALEKTRIGRTINLLRKKTENAELAKRAKKLVKKWQTLVVSHLESLRIADSPLNGQRSSPQVNGIIANEGERPNSAGSEKLDKCKLLEGKRKRKREKESSSSESSPVIFSKNLHEIKRRGESGRKSTSPTPKSKKLAIAALLTKGSSCPIESTTNKTILINDIGKANNLVNDPSLAENIPLDAEELKNKNSATNIKELPCTENSKSNDLTTENNVDNSVLKGQEEIDEKNNLNKELVENESTSDPTENDTGNGIHLDAASCDNHDDRHQSSSQNSSGTVELQDSYTSDTNFLQNDLFLSQDSYSCSQESMCSLRESVQTKPPFIPTESMLDMSAEVTGITGRYGSDGQWYSWTDVMPLSDGALSILPYVILD